MQRRNYFLFALAPVLLAALLLTAALTPRAASAAEDAPRFAAIDNCDGNGSFNGTADYRFKKEGFASLNYAGSNLWFTGKFRAVNVSGIPFEEAYLEFWLYTEQADNFSDNGQIEINSSGGINDANEFHWSLPALNLAKGWNYVSVKFTDAEKVGRVDYGSLNYIRIYQFGKDGSSLEAWLDDVRITSSQTVVADSELGVDAPDNETPEPPTEEEVRGVWTDYLAKMLETIQNQPDNRLNTIVLIFSICQGVLAAGVLALFVILTLKTKKRGRKK